MKQVFIIGMGLIGGSIGLAIKQHHASRVVGFDLNENALKMAKARGVIDEIAPSLEQGAIGADVIIVAAPVVETEKIIEELSGLPLKDKVIITDVGSTKKQIVQKAIECLGDRAVFIGGHPMAGSHKSGVEAARAHLFENAFYVLTPPEGESEDEVAVLKEILQGTKANFIILSPHEHDKIAGAISHFPHVIAAGLVHQIQKLQEKNPLVTSLAAGGFRDITRIASSSPVMWRDILIHNKDTLLSLLQDWRKELARVEHLIEMESGEGIHDYFADAKRFRDHLPQKTKGAIPAFFDLYVDVPDVPGVISEVTGILGEEKISITNIQIIEEREDVLGVLRISFRADDDRSKAKRALEDKGFESFLSS